MHRFVPQRQSDSVTPTDPPDDREQIEQREPRNLLVIALYQVVIRVGWIFKTESVIVPAFLDSIGGQAWLRGFLPTLNRIGQSVPPVLFSRQLKLAPRKKWSMMRTTLAMAASFLALSFIWWQAGAGAWMPFAFLVLYTVFFVSTGLNQVSLGTLQGKLIRPARRGRLMSISSVAGGAVAIFFAWWLMGQWLRLPDGGFGYLFGFTGLCFLLAAIATMLLIEPADNYQEPAVHWTGHFAAAWRILRDDVPFRRLAIVAMLFNTVMVLFPHYQALAHKHFADGVGDLMAPDLVAWVIVQNAGTMLFSMLAGPVADRRGNRLVLQGLVVLSGVTPLLALVLVGGDPATARPLFSVVFLMIGLTPIAMRTLMNYTLEIAPPSEHPRYLSTLGLCLAAPLLLSPLAGAMVDWVGFSAVFIAGSVLILTGAWRSLGLIEPRGRRGDGELGPLGDE